MKLEHGTSDLELRWLSDLNKTASLAGLRDAMRDRRGALDVDNLHSLAIVGAAPEGRRLARICQDRGITIDAIVDDDPAKAGLVVAGVSIAPVQTLADLPRSTPVAI